MRLNHFSLIFIITLVLGGCSKKAEETPVVETAKPKYLYVSSGLCNAGPNTTFNATTASNQSYRLNAITGQKDLALADYYSVPANAGDTPISTIEADSSSLFVLVENATSGRRIEKLGKTSLSVRQLYNGNTTALSAVLKGMIKTPDGGVLIAKTAGIEKLTSQGVRLGAPYVGTNLGATCGTSNTNISGVSVTSTGKILFINAAASNNRWGIIGANGYTTASDCLGVANAPDVNAYPVAIQYIASSSQILVAYAGASIGVNLNSIYAYDFNETTNAITGATRIYDSTNYVANGYLLFSISAMAFNPDDKSLFVATAISNAATVANYTIEKLSYDPSSKALSRPQSASFYNYGVDTKCISSISIAD